jgi:hypothetical protein
MQVPGNPVKRAVQFWFMGENEGIKYNLGSHLSELELNRGLAGAKVVVAVDKKISWC